jgi:hypothetical protein
MVTYRNTGRLPKGRAKPRTQDTMPLSATNDDLCHLHAACMHGEVQEPASIQEGAAQKRPQEKVQHLNTRVRAVCLRISDFAEILKRI